jgi:NTE family protein
MCSRIYAIVTTMRSRLVALFLVLLFLVPASAQSREKTLVFKLEYAPLYGGLRKPVAPATDAPKLGLALAGGGARAAASLGVLKALEQEGIPVSAIAGTSGGALVGGFYAAGYGPAEIERIFIDNDWNDIFKDTPSRAFLTQEQKEAGSRYLLQFMFDEGGLAPPSGLSAGQKLTNLLMAKTLAASFEADLDFNRLRVPFRAIATDIETGNAVPLARGLLHEALRASSAIPLVFQPVEIDGKLYVDGGLSNNLPVETAKSLGVDVVVAVDPSAKLGKKEQLSTLFSIMNQSISLQVRKETGRQKELADLLIIPRTDDFSFTDFPSMKYIIVKGEEAAREALPRIRELMRPRARALGEERFHITDLAVQGNVAVPGALLRATMAAALPSREVTEQDILAALAAVFALGLFSDVSLELEKQGEAYTAVLFVVENPVVKDVSVSGNTLVSANELEDFLAWQVGAPLNGMKLAAELEILVKKLRSEGYLLAGVERVSLEESGVLKIKLAEGRVDGIEVEGRIKTRQSLFKRETQTRPGAPLNFEILADDLQHLYAMDYFESLDVGMAQSKAGGVNLTLKAREKPANRLRLGLRYDLEDSFTGLTDIVVDNITGRGIKAFLNSRYGNYTDLTLGYNSPVFLHTYFLHTVQAFYRDRTYFLYENKHKVDELDISRTGLDVAFGYQWFRFGDTYLRYRYASDTAEKTLGISPAKDITRIGSWAFLSTVDTRDSQTFPHAGVLLKGSYENASPASGSTREFAKTTLLGQGFIPLAERHTVMLEASAGFGSGTIPYEEKFGIGGADYLISVPLQGYQRREFVGSNEMGFSLAWQWKLAEYQLNVVKGIYLRVIGQAANVWDTRDAMTTRDLRGGVGAGLHADSIIGPIRLDFGFGEDRRAAVYFSAGFDF